MKLSQFYRWAVAFGSDEDPRRNKRIDSYADTAILYGDPDTDIKKILVGIDIEVSELLLAQRFRERDALDLVLAHHPHGRALAGLYRVMQLQVDVLKSSGVRERVAQELLNERMREVERKISPANLMRTVDAASLLQLPFMCVHTPADNHVYSYIQRLLNREKPKKVQDAVDILMTIPEYKSASRVLMGPRIILGSPKRHVGKIMVDMTGGTEGSREVFSKLRTAGVRTLVAMHLSEDHFKKVKDANLNVVIAGHISSDTLGLNLLLDKIEKRARETFQTISCSGFTRIRRK